VHHRAVAPLVYLAVALVAKPVMADEDAASDAEVFERVFKQPHRRDLAPVVLFIDDVEIPTDGPLVLELAHGSPQTACAPIIAALVPQLQSQTAARLQKACRDHRISVDRLRALGLGATYDPDHLELRLAIPVALRPRTSHELGSRGPANTLGALPPSDVSGYLNLRAGSGGTWSTGHAATTPRPAHLNTDAALAVHGWVLEARGDAVHAGDGAETIAIHRGDVLLSHDVPRHALRYMLGDFAVPAGGLQSSYQLLGGGVGRNYALQPYRVIRPAGTFDFVLDRPSRVTVFVNGAVVQTLSLAAGRHDIRDLPLGAGVNNIELLIKDDGGIERRVAFSAANPDALLAPGIVQFSLGIGFALTEDVGLRSYDFAHPIVSGRRRWALTRSMTVGGSLDGALDHQVAGAELTVATILGNLSTNVAASHQAREGTAIGVRYDYSRTANKKLSTVTLAGHHYSPGFITFGAARANERYSDDVSIGANRRLTARVGTHLDARYQVGRDVRDAQDAALGLTVTFGKLGVDTVVSARRDAVIGDEARVFVTMHWMPGRARSVHTASRASSVTGVSNEATYSEHPTKPVGGLASTLTVSENPAQLGAAGTLEYTGYQFTTAVTTATQIERGDGRVSQSAGFEAATALAFAGGRASWSRPITGSFAIIERNPSLGNVAIGVNPALGGYAGRTDSFGLAVVPGLEAYRVSVLTVDAPALPPGYSLGPASHTLMPAYRTGTLVRVGEDGTVFIRGVLVGSDSAPIAYGLLELVSIEAPKRAPIAVMTNRAGRFGAMGLQPGHYTLRFTGDTAAAGSLTIPPKTTGVYAVGTLVVVR
jgi:outer membrane usher protein